VPLEALFPPMPPELLLTPEPPELLVLPELLPAAVPPLPFCPPSFNSEAALKQAGSAVNATATAARNEAPSSLALPSVLAGRGPPRQLLTVTVHIGTPGT
jgi:hypothetical protein